MRKSQQLDEQTLTIGARAYLNKPELTLDLITVIEALARQPGPSPKLPGLPRQADMAHRQMRRPTALTQLHREFAHIHPNKLKCPALCSG